MIFRNKCKIYSNWDSFLLLLWPKCVVLMAGERPCPIYYIKMVDIPSKSQNADSCYASFFHHYQGSIDFNTVNIHHTVGMYFLVSTGNRGDIEWDDLQRSYYPIHSLLPEVYVSILSLGTVFPRTLPMANILARKTLIMFQQWCR